MESVWSTSNISQATAIRSTSTFLMFECGQIPVFENNTHNQKQLTKQKHNKKAKAEAQAQAQSQAKEKKPKHKHKQKHKHKHYHKQDSNKAQSTIKS